MDKSDEIWETYRESWSNANSFKRIDDLGKVMTKDFEYRDPNIALRGYKELSDYMARFQEEFPGAYFDVTEFQFHHDRSLSHWSMKNSENEVVGRGMDFAIYENGKLKQITGFFYQD